MTSTGGAAGTRLLETGGAAGLGATGVITGLMAVTVAGAGEDAAIGEAVTSGTLAGGAAGMRGGGAETGPGFT
jgi:hypothetical protein